MWGCENPVTEIALVLRPDGYSEFTGQRKRGAFCRRSILWKHSGWEGAWQVWEAERRPMCPTCRLRKRMVGNQTGQVGWGQTAQDLIGHVKALSSSRQ